MASQPLYPIGIVAELIGVRPETLRVWDREGLVTPKRWRRSRCYSDADLERVLFVRHLLGEEGLNLAAVRGYVKLYHCWPLGDCVPCHDATTATGKPCWKRPGAYCGLAEEESLLCSSCSERDSHATTLPFALHQLREASGNDAPTPAAGRRQSADKKPGLGLTNSRTRVSAKRSNVRRSKP
jgi:MerR family transcriptional regulator/heat shock protein HspR